MSKKGDSDSWSRKTLRWNRCHGDRKMIKNTQKAEMKEEQDSHLLQGNHPDEAADAGDVGVVEAQQGEDGVSLWKRQKHKENQQNDDDFC